MKRRDLLISSAGAAMWPALRGGTARGAALRTFGGTLVAAILDKGPATLGGANPRTLDPHRARSLLERELASALHATLLFAPGELRRRPGPLVEALSVSPRDARVWTLTLRRGLTFHDGAAIDAEAVAASLARSLAMPAGRALALSIAAVRVRGADAVEIETRVPFRDLAPLLSTTASSVVSLRSSASPDVFWGPAGAGGFLPGTVSSSTTPRITLLANPRAAQGRAFVDELALVPALEGADAAAALRKGTIHVARGSGGAPERERVRGEAVSTFALVISATLPADARARIAAAPARRVLCEQFLPHRADPAATLLPAGILGPLAAIAGADVPRGAKLSPPLRTRLAVADVSREIGEVAERLVWDLLEVGVEAKRVFRSPDTLEDHATHELWELMLVEIAPEDTDPGRALAALTRDPLLAPALTAADRASLDALAAIEDADARTAAARAADDAIRAGGLLIPIVHPRRLLRRGERVEGLAALLPDGRVDWAEAGVRADRSRGK